MCSTAGEIVGTKNGYRVYRCQGCAQLFVWPPPDQPLDIYSEKYFAGGENGFGYVDYDRDKEPMIPTFEKYLDLIERYTNPSGRLLDVGAATGFFLHLAHKRGWTASGIEPCDYAARLARAKGLDVHTGVLEKPLGPFQVITALDVIEHLPDPRGFVRIVNQSLEPKGILAINTPDGGSAIAKRFGVNWHAVLPPEHLQLFNRQSLDMLLHQEGFEVLEHTWIGKRFTLQYVFQTLARVQRIEAWSGAAASLHRTRLGQIAIPLNLRDNLFVLARKRPAA